MKRPKYHFLTIKETPTGKSVYPLPGQTFGRSPVNELIRIKATGGAPFLTKLRTRLPAGTVLFTTTLTRTDTGYTVKDAYPLKGNDLVLYHDAREEYEKYTEKQAPACLS